MPQPATRGREFVVATQSVKKIRPNENVQTRGFMHYDDSINPVK